MLPALILFSSLILRLFPRFYWKEFRGTDAHFHFYYTQLIKNHKNKIPPKEPRIVGGNNECTYPFFYHWLLSFLSKKSLNHWDKISGFVWDGLNGLIVILLLSVVKTISLTEICLILASYMIAPGLTFSFIGPRPYSLTPRNFSQFVFFLGCVLLILTHGHSFVISNTGFVLGSVAFAILILSSQFGCQVLCFLLLAIFFEPRIGLAVLLGALLSLFFFQGFVIPQVKAHIGHLKWYFRYNYAFVQHKTNFSKLIHLLKNKNIRGVFYELIFYNQMSTSLLRHFTYFASVGIGWYKLKNNNLTILQEDTFFILLLLGIAFILTNFGKARVFGEAERYIEFTYPLHTFLFLSFIPLIYLEKLLYGLFFYNFLWYLYNLYQIKHQNAFPYSFNNLLSFISKPDSTLLCLNNNESYIFLHKSKVKIVGFLVNISLDGKYGDFFKNFFTQYPFVNTLYLDKICKKYGVTHILKNKETTPPATKEIDLSSLLFKLVYEDNKYALYEKNI